MLLLRLTSALEEFGVRYAVAGGHAVALHGAPRGTLDVDLVIPETQQDYIRAQKALASIGLQSRLPVDAKQIFRFRKEYQKNRELTAWSFMNPERPSELVDILLAADLNSLRTEIKRHGKHRIHIIALEDLMEMKKKGGRPQDRADLKALREVQKLRRRKS